MGDFKGEAVKAIQFPPGPSSFLWPVPCEPRVQAPWICHVREIIWKNYIELEGDAWGAPSVPASSWLSFPELCDTQTCEWVSFQIIPASSLWAGPADAEWSRNKLSPLSPVQMADSWQNQHCYCLKSCCVYYTVLHTSGTMATINIQTRTPKWQFLAKNHTFRTWLLIGNGLPDLVSPFCIS